MAAAYPRDTSGTAWLSRGFEVLVDRVLKNPLGLHFDVLIVGSGYGGSIAAAAFAGADDGAGNAVHVGVLERGREYLPGAFPVGLRELPGHVRGQRVKEGLFDIRLGPEVNTVVANGLGGGSLINAGVMEVPQDEVFAQGWPAALSNPSTWKASFDAARELLGSRVAGAPNTILDHPDGLPQKYQALLTVGSVRPAEITVAMQNATSSGNVALKKCVRCGDCATGCNFGAKNSLDVNLLARAHENGAEIFSGATVLGIEHDNVSNVWLVDCVHTSEALRSRDEVVADQVVKVRAKKVVLAAGTLGSTEILLRSKDDVQLSGMLGQRCSTNGDMLITDYATSAAVHTVADESVKPSERAIGPTITGIIDVPKTAGRPKLTIEEMSVPAGLRVAFTEVFATINALHSLAEKDSVKHAQGFPADDIYAVSKEQIERSALYAVMGDDGAAGSIELNVDDGTELSVHDDGIARMRWPKNPAPEALPDVALFRQQVEALTELTKDKTGGRLLPNPVWKLLPADLEWLMQNKRGPLTTVHPLGGCAMADSGADGVVDDRGRVFSSSNSAAVHDGLVVLDGSIIPTALGTNPALTIAAVALRAVELLAGDWGYGPPPAPGAVAPVTRPSFRATDSAFAPAQKSEVEIIERLVGPVEFKDDAGSIKTRVVELTLRFAPKAIIDFARPPQDGGNPVLQVSGTSGDSIASRIRIYDEVLWRQMERRWTPDKQFEKELEALSLFSAPLTGSLKVFERQKSFSLGRIWRAGWAWFFNRGMRDINIALNSTDGGPGPWSRFVSGTALASRAGEIRALTYDLTIGNPEPGAVLELNGTARRILGKKTFTYARRSNPWRQLMEVELEEFPGLKGSAEPRVLALDTRYLARIGVPLFRLVGQHDGASALADAGTFLGYFVRLLLGIHIWSFRAPDPYPSAPQPKPLPPKNLPPLQPADQFAIALDPEAPDGREPDEKYAGQVILTHFAAKNPDPAKLPLVMLHGYSASGTTFAHHAVPGNFAEFFTANGWDVWIADLRTSSGQPDSARQPWSFEQIGRVDVPAVFNKVTALTGKPKVDVVAHCMGTVVFSMAVLDPNPTAENKVRDQVERAAFTQVGPLVVFSPANRFRGYVLRYFVDFLPDNYSFNPPPTLAEDLWDRLLATLPYPVEEFDIENPPHFKARTPWTRTRHRMDALYGRDFNVANMEPAMLACIDDHFGALSLWTVKQTLNFVRYSLITNWHGRNEFVSRNQFQANWKFPTLSVHGAANGLAHVSTVDRMHAILGDAGRTHEFEILDETGHQDALVGTKRSQALAAIEKFLSGPAPNPPGAGNDGLVAYTPWIGPIVTEQRDVTPALVVRVASSPMHRAAVGMVMLRVAIDGDRVVRPDDPSQLWDINYVMSHAELVLSNELTTKRWDAFEAPLPTSMPGYQAGDAIGDGLLVLILYADSALLEAERANAPVAYYGANASTNTVDILLPSPEFQYRQRPNRISYGYFEKAAAALLTALQKQPPSARERRRAARLTPGHPVLVRARMDSPLELPIEPVAIDVQLPATATALSFAVNTAQGAAVVAAIDQDDDLMDGVILYDPPQPPLAAPESSGTRFALVSCQYPGGFLDGPVAYASYRRMLQRFEGPPDQRPRFAVFTGDQVYVDPTAGLYDPNAQDDRYYRPYEVWLRQQPVRSVLRRIPSFMLLDDHEIHDNWEPVPPQSKENKENTGDKAGGVTAYEKFQRGMVPKPPSFAFAIEGFRFFMLDTRTQRSLRTVGSLAPSTLFPAATLTALKTFLQSDPQNPKFVVTPSMLLPRHRRAVQHAPPGGGVDADNLSAVHSDGWDGYPESLAAVLGFIAEQGIQHVVFLSGDEHRGCVARIELRQGGALRALLHSIHTTAAYAPFPFANSLPEDFVTTDVFAFDYSGTTYECIVNAMLPATRDGATLLRPWRDGSTVGLWHLDYEYADGGVQTLTL